MYGQLESALELIAALIEGVHAHWREIADEASLSEIDRGTLWRRQFLNPYAFEGAPADLAALEPRE